MTHAIPWRVLAIAAIGAIALESFHVIDRSNARVESIDLSYRSLSQIAPSGSREDFFAEALDARATPRTPLFEDAGPGSYHADKDELTRLLPPFARDHGYSLRAVIVVGPDDPLWTYHVIAFLDEAGAIRVNHVVFAHARITSKWTRTITQDAYERLFIHLRGTGVADRRDDFTGAAWVERDAEPAAFSSSGKRSPQVVWLSQALDQLLEPQTRTY